MSSHKAGQHALHGVVVMDRTGVQLYTGWVSRPAAPVPLAQLCSTVSDVFRGGDQRLQDSSYLDAGSFVAASTADGGIIVSVIATPACPETEVSSPSSTAGLCNTRRGRGSHETGGNEVSALTCCSTTLPSCRCC
jgi:hypothetical protein